MLWNLIGNNFENEKTQTDNEKDEKYVSLRRQQTGCTINYSLYEPSGPIATFGAPEVCSNSSSPSKVFHNAIVSSDTKTVSEISFIYLKKLKSFINSDKSDSS